VRITSLIVVSLMLPTPAAFADIPVVSYPMLSSASVRQQTPFDDLRAEFKLTIPDNDKQIEYWRKYYLADRYHLNIVANNMLPFIPIILKKIKEKKLPAELAIIPMVESCYRVNEGSHKGAIGLWQINAITAVEFELVDEWNYDARLDVLATTDAALNYLKSLYQQFKSWPLAFAAYNVGPSRVKTALKKINYRYDSDFYKLDLPKETLNFVPKILALSQIIKYHEFYDLDYSDHYDELVAVKCSYPIDFRDFILAFSVPLNILKKYNPGFTMFMIPKNKKDCTILIPRSYLGSYQYNPENKLKYVNKTPVYAVQKGDSLTKIAAKFDMSVQYLIEHNQLKSNILQPGQLLHIPPISITMKKYVAYKVKAGDTLYTIARQHDTTANHIMRVNNLKSSVIRANQILQIPQGKQ